MCHRLCRGGRGALRKIRDSSARAPRHTFRWIPRDHASQHPLSRRRAGSARSALRIAHIQRLSCARRCRRRGSPCRVAQLQCGLGADEPAAAQHRRIGIAARVESAPGSPAVVMMIALGANELAVAAMREGALAYLSKPVNSDELLLVLERCLERVRLAREAEALKDQLEELRRFDNAFGSAPAVPFATMLDFERYIILKTLAATGGSVAKAAAALGISVRKIQYRLRDYRKVGEVERSQTGPDRGASSCAPSLQSRE